MPEVNKVYFCMSSFSAIVIGSGPSGCLTALELIRRGAQVKVYAKEDDPRLTVNGSDSLVLIRVNELKYYSSVLLDSLLVKGKVLTNVVNHSATQASGIAYDNTDVVISISWRALMSVLLNIIESAGSAVHFNHNCYEVDTKLGHARFIHHERLVQVQGHLLVGADGVNSVVRQHMASNIESCFDVIQKSSLYCLMQSGILSMDSHCPVQENSAHQWRGSDSSFLFIPGPNNTACSSLRIKRDALTSKGVVDSLFLQYSEMEAVHPTMLQVLTSKFAKQEVTYLKEVKCSAYHQGVAVLVGEAASSLHPKDGMEFNSVMNDVRLLMNALDINAKIFRSCDSDSIFRAVESSLVSYTTRKTFHDKCINHALSVEPHIREPVLTCPSIDTFRYYNPNSLRLSSEQVQNLMDLVSKIVVQHQSDLRTGKQPPSTVFDCVDASTFKDGHEVSAQLRELSPPEEGINDVESFLNDLLIKFRVGCHNPHPGFMARIPNGGLFQGLLGSFLGRSFNRMASIWSEAPAFTQIETNVINWFCRMMGYDKESFGYLTSGGSISNWMAIICAIRRHRGDYDATVEVESNLDTCREIVYVSAQSHFSNKKATKLAGYNKHNLRIVAVNADLTMNLEDLKAKIMEDVAKGLTPVCVIGTAGTTNTGAIDNLQGIAAIAVEFNLWFHCDAAFGGFFNITSRGKKVLKGIHLADSITVDAHKSLFMPMGISAILVKKRMNLRNAFQVSSCAVYLSGFSHREDQPDFCQYGPELSRDFRGLTVYIPMKLHGLKVFEEHLNQVMDLANYLYSQLLEFEEIECIQVHSVLLPVVNFKVKRSSVEISSALSFELVERICSKGNVFLTTTELPSHGSVVRVCIMNHFTDKAHVDQLLTDLRCSLKELSLR